MESLIYWRDVKKSGIVFGAGLSVLIAMSLFSLISVFSYVSLLVLFGTVSFRIYKNVLQAVQKTAEGHPFKWVFSAFPCFFSELVFMVWHALGNIWTLIWPCPRRRSSSWPRSRWRTLTPCCRSCAVSFWSRISSIRSSLASSCTA